MLPEDYEYPEEPQRKRASSVPWRPIAVSAAVAGVVALLGVSAYGLFGGGNDDGTPPIVRADQRPAKVRPENPGGMEVPHRDLEVWDNVERTAGRGPGGGGGQQRVERLLPPPEAPPTRPPGAPPPLQADVPPAPDMRPPPGAVEVRPPSATATAPPAPSQAPAPPPSVPPPSVRQAPPPAATSTPPQAAAAAQRPRQTPPAPVPPRTEGVQLRPPAQANDSDRVSLRPPGGGATPPQLAQAPSGAAGAVRLRPPGGGDAGQAKMQFGVLPSAEAAAREWSRLQRSHQGVLGGLNASVVRVGNGRFAIQAGPMPAGEARRNCADLSRRRVGCVVVPQ